MRPPRRLRTRLVGDRPGHPHRPPQRTSEIRLGTYRDLWADYVSERNPALRFLAPAQTLELNPEDAERLGVGQGQMVEVSADGHSIQARVSLRERMLEGTGFLIEGWLRTAPTGSMGPSVVKVAPAPEEPAEELEVKTYGSTKREAVQWT